MLACDPMSCCPAAKYSWVHLCAIYTHEKELSRSLGQKPRDLPPPHGNIHRLAGLYTWSQSLLVYGNVGSNMSQLAISVSEIGNSPSFLMQQ